MENHIPKIIHYCWFGKSEKKDLVLKCIESWKKFLPDYKIIEWNEDNFNVNSSDYTKEAYKHKKWAFVSDYVRLYALYNYGGIYLDTDVEVKNSLSKFLNYPLFLGFHNSDTLLTAVLGCRKENKVIKELLDLYKDKKFTENGVMNLQINNELITNFFIEKYTLLLNNKNQILDDNIYIFEQSFFAEKVYGKENFTIHHGDGSWYTIDKAMNELKTYKQYYLIMIELTRNLIQKKRLRKELIEKKIAIYGYGEIGKILLEILKVQKIKPICIIDKNIINKECSEIDIINLNDINEYDIDYIIITPVMYYNEIESDIRNKRTDINLISVKDIYEV